MDKEWNEIEKRLKNLEKIVYEKENNVFNTESVHNPLYIISAYPLNCTYRVSPDKHWRHSGRVVGFSYESKRPYKIMKEDNSFVWVSEIIVNSKKYVEYLESVITDIQLVISINRGMK